MIKLGPSKCPYSMSNTTMTQTEINGAISQAFATLSNLNEQVYDYWVSELYTLDGAMIDEMWNEQTLYEMETDVMQNSWTLISFIHTNEQHFQPRRTDL